MHCYFVRCFTTVKSIYSYGTEFSEECAHSGVAHPPEIFLLWFGIKILKRCFFFLFFTEEHYEKNMPSRETVR